MSRVNSQMAPTKRIQTATAKSIDRLFADPALAKSVVLAVNQGRTFNEAEGVTVDVFVQYSVLAVFVEKEKFVIPAPGETGIKVTESSFLLRTKDMPEGYSKQDSITDDEGRVFKLQRLKPILDVALKVEVIGT